jgi:hypothetical protein
MAAIQGGWAINAWNESSANKTRVGPFKHVNFRNFRLGPALSLYPQGSIRHHSPLTRMDSEETSMWAMPDGHRIATDAEWNLLLFGLESLHDSIEIALLHPELGPMQRHLPPFDALTGEQQLMVLAEVAGSLRWKYAPIPEHTAAREAAVAAIFDELIDRLRLEIDELETPGSTRIRQALLDAADEEATGESLPSASEKRIDVWTSLLEDVKSRILWDEDYLLADEFLDLPPEEADDRYLVVGIDRDYFVWTPDEPKADELRIARGKLAELRADRPALLGRN